MVFSPIQLSFSLKEMEAEDLGALEAGPRVPAWTALRTAGGGGGSKSRSRASASRFDLSYWF